MEGEEERRELGWDAEDTDPISRFLSRGKDAEGDEGEEVAVGKLIRGLSGEAARREFRSQAAGLDTERPGRGGDQRY